MTAKSLLLVGLALFCSRGVSAVPIVLRVAPDKGAVEFNAIGKPSALKIHGKGPGPKGSISVDGTQVSGELKFDLAALETGLSLRDKHMKEKYLEVSKFPQAILKLTSAQLPEKWKVSTEIPNTTEFKGLLTLHGIEKPVTGTFSARPKAGTSDASAKFTLKLSDFKVDIPNFSGITVADQVDVEVTMVLSEEKIEKNGSK